MRRAETISKSFSRWHCSCIVFSTRETRSFLEHVPPSFDQRSRERCPRIPKEMFSLDRRESGAGRLATSAKIREIFIDRSCTHLASSPRSGATTHVASSHPRCNVTVRENCVGSTLQIIPLTVHPRRPLNSSRASRCLSRIEKTLD